MKTYVKPTIKVRELNVDSEILAASTIQMYGDDDPITNDDNDYVEGAKYNTWSSKGLWADDEDE